MSSARGVFVVMLSTELSEAMAALQRAEEEVRRAGDEAFRDGSPLNIMRYLDAQISFLARDADVSQLMSDFLEERVARIEKHLGISPWKPEPPAWPSAASSAIRPSRPRSGGKKKARGS